MAWGLNSGLTLPNRLRRFVIIISTVSIVFKVSMSWWMLRAIFIKILINFHFVAPLELHQNYLMSISHIFFWLHESNKSNKKKYFFSFQTLFWYFLILISITFYSILDETRKFNDSLLLMTFFNLWLWRIVVDKPFLFFWYFLGLKVPH